MTTLRASRASRGARWSTPTGCPTARPPPAAGYCTTTDRPASRQTRSGRPVSSNRLDSVVSERDVDVLRVESDELSDPVERHAPLGDEATHEPFARAQPLRDVWHSEQTSCARMVARMIDRALRSSSSTLVDNHGWLPTLGGHVHEGHTSRSSVTEGDAAAVGLELLPSVGGSANAVRAGSNPSRSANLRRNDQGVCRHAQLKARTIFVPRNSETGFEKESEIVRRRLSLPVVRAGAAVGRMGRVRAAPSTLVHGAWSTPTRLSAQFVRACVIRPRTTEGALGGLALKIAP